MERRRSMPVWRFGLMVVFMIVGAIGLYVGTLQMWTEPSVSWMQPLHGKSILIDAGHGGVDPGAVSASGVLEKDVTLQVAFQLRDLLQQAGAQVQLLREEDTDLASPDTKGYSRRKSEDLKERVKRINESDASILISLHCNAIPEAQWSGAQTFFDDERPENEKLASAIQESLRETLDMSRTIKQRKDIYLLKRSEKTGALVELGFLSNPQEAQLLRQKSHQQALALSIYKGILAYYADLE